MKRTNSWLHRLFGHPRSARFRRSLHRTLGPLLQLPALLHRRVGFVTVNGRNRFTWIPNRRLGNIVSNIIKHLGMTLNLWRDRDSEIFLLFEHKADFALPLYLLFLLKGKPVFFFVHDMQQVATVTLRCRTALNLCRAWVRLGEFYPVFISLDDRSLEPGYRFAPEKCLTVAHPHPLADRPVPRTPRVPGAAWRVGLIETGREEKSIRQIYAQLREAQKRLGFLLVVGTPKRNKLPWLEGEVELVDTTRDAQFSAYLRGLDVFACDFLRSDYYFRPSGAINDAGMNGCYVVCPDFPVFRAMIEEPVCIGSTYSRLEELPEVLEKAFARLAAGPIDFAAWREPHRVERIAGQFQEFLEEREKGR